MHCIFLGKHTNEETTSSGERPSARRKAKMCEFYICSSQLPGRNGQWWSVRHAKRPRCLPRSSPLRVPVRPSELRGTRTPPPRQTAWPRPSFGNRGRTQPNWQTRIFKTRIRAFWPNELKKVVGLKFDPRANLLLMFRTSASRGVS